MRLLIFAGPRSRRATPVTPIAVRHESSRGRMSRRAGRIETWGTDVNVVQARGDVSVIARVGNRRVGESRDSVRAHANGERQAPAGVLPAACVAVGRAPSAAGTEHDHAHDHCRLDSPWKPKREHLFPDRWSRLRDRRFVGFLSACRCSAALPGTGGRRCGTAFDPCEDIAVRVERHDRHRSHRHRAADEQVLADVRRCQRPAGPID